MIFSYSKSMGGHDERGYIFHGKAILESGLNNVLYLPVISIVFYFSSIITSDEVQGLKILYLISLLLIGFVQFKFSLKLGIKKYPIIPSIITIIIPGILVLNLYSLGNLLSASLILLGIYLISINMEKNRIVLVLLIGVLFSLIYQIRLDSLIVFIFICFLWPFLHSYKIGDYKKYIIDIFLILTSFILVLLPWQLYLFDQGLLFSAGVTGNTKTWPNGIMQYFFNPNYDIYINKDLVMKPESNARIKSWKMEGFDLYYAIQNIDKITILMLNNLYENLKTIGSPKLIPIFFIPLLGIGFTHIKKNRLLLLYSTPLLCFLPYLAYGNPSFDMTRFFTPLMPFVGMCIGYFILESRNDKLLMVKFLIVFILLLSSSITFYFLGNTTYA